MRRTLMTLAIATLVAGIPTYAHHSFAADYFEEQSITIEGDVQEFQFRNPHSLLMFDVKDQGGRVQMYTAEWGNVGRLTSQGVSKESLKYGDHVVITGSPGRIASAFRVHLKGIERPSDGWQWGGGRR